jgi:type IX secretion system PorP/SprF family membrane protein
MTVQPIHIYVKKKSLPFRFFRIAALLFFANSVLGQDTHFSQFYMSPLTMNPAMAGASYDMEAFLTGRNQWQSVATPYQTVAATFDMRFNKKKLKKGFWSAGLNFYNDKAGDLQMTTTQVSLSGAYHVRLNEFNTLGAGMQAGIAQRTLGSGTIRTGNQYNGLAYDPNLATGESLTNTSVTYADAGAGVVWTYNNTSDAALITDNHDLKFNFGASVFHVNQPAYSFYNDGEKLYVKYVVHGNALLSIPATNMAFVPSFFYTRQGPEQEIYAGTLLRYKLKQDSKYTGRKKGAALSVGAFFRAGDGLAAATLLEYSNYAIGISYDVNTSTLHTASSFRGGMEITLRFVNPNPFFN